MRINHNISALRANMQLGKNNTLVQKSLERLSSGYRINRASDDAAGLAISQKMKAQIAGLGQASRNGSDGISVMQTAEGALNEVHSMLQRMRELSVQAANGTNTLEDRKAIQEEINKLSNEIDRISTDTEFNKKALLDGGVDRKSYSNNKAMTLVSVSDTVADKDYEITVTENPVKASYNGKAPASGSYQAGEITVSGQITINGESVEIHIGDTAQEVYEKIRELGECTNVSVTAEAMPYTGAEKLNFESMIFGSNAQFSISCSSPELAAALGIDAGGITTTNGADAVVELGKGSGFASTATVCVDGDLVKVTDRNGFEMKIQLGEDAKTSEDPAGNEGKGLISVLDIGLMPLQIGANEGQKMDVRIPKMNCVTLGIANLNVRTGVGAEKAIENIEGALEKVSEIRAKLGAYQNRLEHAVANLDTTGENLDEALSRIADVNMAEEMTNYTQKNILVQANTAMLAQANQLPQNILTLLQA